MKDVRFNRRRLLQGLGSSAALLPWLPVLESEAGGSQAPRRMIFFFTGNGLLRNSLRPGAPGAFDINASSTLMPLADYADKMLFVEGVDLSAHLEYAGGNGGDHHPGFAMCMTGGTATQISGSNYTADGPSIDHFIANRLPEGATPFRSLNVGVAGTGHPYSRVFWRGAGQVATSEDNPATVFNALFGDIGAEQEAAEALRQRRVNVLDSVSDRLSVLRGRLGSADRDKFDAHLQSVNELQGQLNVPHCSAPALTPGEAYETDGDNQIDIIAAALACNLTQVVALQWNSCASGQVLPEISPLAHHALNHWQSDTNLDEATAWALVSQIDAWYATKLARLCDKLAAIPEGDGSVLDNTTILWCSEHGWPGGHDRYNLPYTIIGDCGGYFDTGRYVSYNGVSNNDLYISLCHAMGLEDVTVFGAPELCSGPLSGLSV